LGRLFPSFSHRSCGDFDELRFGASRALFKIRFFLTKANHSLHGGFLTTMQILDRLSQDFGIRQGHRAVPVRMRRLAANGLRWLSQSA